MKKDKIKRELIVLNKKTKERSSIMINDDNSIHFFNGFIIVRGVDRISLSRMSKEYFKEKFELTNDLLK